MWDAEDEREGHQDRVGKVKLLQVEQAAENNRC